MNERGFQLYELMLVCAAAGVLLAIGVGPIWNSVRHHRLEAAAQDFVAALASARSSAIAGNLTTEMHIHPDRRRFSAAAGGGLEGWRDLPSELEFSRVPAGTLRFFSRGGVAPAGTFRITGPTGSVRVIVAPTGRIRWEHEERP